MRKLGRKKANRDHLMRNLASSLVLYEYLDTTAAKAKEVKSFVEKLIARNKTNSLSNKRNIFSLMFDKNAAQKVINELLPRYENRKSGFIRSFHLKNRLGDNSQMIRLELVDKKVFSVKEKSKTPDAKEIEKKDEVSVEIKSKKAKKDKVKDNAKTDGK